MRTTSVATVIRRWIAQLTGQLAVLLLASCRGGGAIQPATMAPSDLVYPAPPAFVMGTAIKPLTPTVVGDVASYSVSPGLPSGLSLNTTTGVISGTPSRVASKAGYTIKATNAGGSTKAVVSIVVNDIAPSIAYSSSSFAFTADIAAQPITPTVGGGAVVTWAIKPALPAGLVFNTTDGTISGTPTAAAAPSPYMITATNSRRAIGGDRDPGGCGSAFVESGSFERGDTELLRKFEPRQPGPERSLGAAFSQVVMVRAPTTA